MIRKVCAAPLLLLAAASWSCGDGPTTPNAQPPTENPRGHKHHSNTVDLEFTSAEHVGGDVMNLDGWYIDGFTLLDNVSTPGYAAEPYAFGDDNQSKTVCDPMSSVMPCGCFGTGHGGKDGNCGHTEDSLTFYTAREDSTEVADLFSEYGEMLPLLAIINEESEDYYGDNGAYPETLTFMFVGQVTISNGSLYITCQDMIFAQTEVKDHSTAKYATKAFSSAIKAGQSAGEVIEDPVDPEGWVDLTVDLGETLEDIIDIFLHSEPWFLAGGGDAGFSFAKSSGGNNAESVTFQCPATNGSYYAVRIGNNKIIDKGYSNHEFRIFAIHVIDKKWVRDVSTTTGCVENPVDSENPTGVLCSQPPPGLDKKRND
jgi:hypothetical protein